jgi:hypothetical protein
MHGVVIRNQLDQSPTFWDLEEIALLRNEAESWILDAEVHRNPFSSLPPL